MIQGRLAGRKPKTEQERKMLIVTNLNSHLYQRELKKMYRLRHKVLVEGRGWTDLASDDKAERDEFDTRDAIYLMTVEENGDVSGCLRLIPSICKNLTSTVFSHLCDLRPLTIGADIYDASRIVVDPDWRHKGQTNQAAEILCAWFEMGRALELSHYNGIIDTRFLHGAIAAGWDVRPLGTPTEVDGESVVALEFAVTDEQLAVVRGRRKLEDNALSDEDIELLRVTHRITHQAPERRAA